MTISLYRPFVGLATAVVFVGVASAQTAVKVTVNLAKPVNILTSTSLGVQALMNDGNTFDKATSPYLKAAGITTVRFPGGTSYADLYHWSTNTASPYKGADTQYRAPESTFANVARMVDTVGTALVVVNYGSNASGTGGGEPVEAAAWVAYANGDPNDTKPLGKDASGRDWQTVGHWAQIRSQAPLAIDDGYNFLRIEHPASLKIKLWQVGNQVYNNGYYGGDHMGEPDLHGPAPASAKDVTKLRKQAELSPATYGTHAAEFADAMKAVDPTVLVGVTLVAPPDGQKWAPEWNTEVLKKACKNIDFESFEWLAGNTMPPDWKTLDEGNLLDSEKSQLGAMLSGILYDDKTSCPKGKIPRIAFAPAGVITWAKVGQPVAEALWISDVYALLVESGSVNVSLPELYSDAMIANDRKKVGPVFSGMQMLNVIAHRPGDQMLDVNSNTPSLDAHATLRRDGVFGLMLVNKDSSKPATVKVSIAGGQVGAKGRRFDYGVAQQKTGSGIATLKIDEVGQEFTISVPPYTITDVLIEK